MFQNELGQQKKMPRLLLAQNDGNLIPLQGIALAWPDRTESSIFDISYSGIAVAATGQLAKVRIGSTYDLKIKFVNSTETVSVKARVLRMSAKMIGLSYDSVSAHERLQVEQGLRDQLILDNLRLLETQILHPSLRADVWYHGPFDTNFLLWQDGQNLKKFIIEYDHLILAYDNGKMTLQRSHSSVEEVRGYGSPMAHLEQQKVSMGAGWLDRLLKVIEVVTQKDSRFQFAGLNLRAQRDQ